MIKVIIAETGTQYEYPLSKFVSQTSLKKAINLLETIEKDHSIAKENQVILREADGKQLEEHMNLEDFIEKDCSIYVYNKVFYRQEQIDDFEVIGNLNLEKKTSESVTQFLPTIYEAHLGKDVMDLIEPENKKYFNDLINVFSDVKSGISSLKDGSIKLKRQKEAEAVAKKNLMTYYNEKKKRFDDNLNSKEAKLNSLQNYINNFDNTILKLSKMEIVTELQEENKKFLIDYFDVAKIKNSKALYEKNHIKIKQKFQDIKDELSQYDKQLKSMEENIPNQYEKLQAQIHDNELEFIDIQDANVQELKNLMSESFNKPTKLDINEFIKAETQRVLPKMKNIDENLMLIRDQIEGSLQQNAAKLKDFITDIANLQSIIRKKIQNKMTIFESLVEKHEKDMFNFEILESFPTTYQKSLEEIFRRNSAIKVHEELIDILERYIDVENRLQQDFLKQNQDFLPKTFCPFFSKKFLPLNFDSIRRLLYDTSVEIKSINLNKSSDLTHSKNESFGFHSSASMQQQSGQIVKIINDFTQKEKSREAEILSLKQNLHMQQQEIDNFAEIMKAKALTASNIRTLFGSLNYDGSFDILTDAFRRGIEERLKKLETKLTNFKNLQLNQVNQVKKSLASGEKIKSNIEELQSKYDELQVKYEELESAKVEADFLIKQKEKLLEETYTKLREDQAKIEDSENTIKVLDEQCREYELKINRMSLDLEEKRQKILDFDQERTKLISENEKNVHLTEYLKNQLKQKTKESKELKDENKFKESMTEAVLTSTKLDSETTINNLKYQLNEKTTELENLKEKYEELNKRNLELLESQKKSCQIQSENAELIEMLRDCNAEIEKLSEEIKTLKNQSSDVLKAKEQEFLEIIKSHENNLVSKTKDLKTKSEALNILEQRCKEAEEKLSEIDILNKKYVEEIQVLQSQLEKNGDDMIPSTYIQLLVSDLGEIIIEIFKHLIGETQFSNYVQKEYEVIEMLAVVKKIIFNQTIKVEEFTEGSTVVAVLIQDTDKEYQLIHTGNFGDEKIIYIYQAEKNLGQIIKGKFKSCSECKDEKLRKKFATCHLLQVELENPDKLVTPQD